MEHTLSLHPLNPAETEPTQAFNVLIAYEDFDTGKHAKKTYDFLVEHLGRECHLTNQMWKFDVLSIPKLREIAIRDAVMADIIIISSHGDAMPEHVTKWIEGWVKEGTQALALVALIEGPEDRLGGSSALRAYLAEVAKRGGMEFFAQPDQWPGRVQSNEPFSLQDSGVTNRTLSTLAGAVHREQTVPRWGINE